MTETATEFINVDRLRVGHYVYIDLSWISHPFPLNSFKIQSADQIDAIRGLGLDRVRYSRQRSDPNPDQGPADLASPAAKDAPVPTSAGVGKKPRDQRRELLAEQHASLQKCERLFGDASRAFRQINDSADAQPEAARDAAQALIESMCDQIRGEQESCIRLLSEKVGERASLHAINVTVISLLLGKTCGLADSVLRDIGVGALLHDLGKTNLPDRLRYSDDQLNGAERQAYREHVRHGVEIGKKMKLSQGALLVVGQHHEHSDGSGYPLRIRDELIAPAARVVALVDQYDNLCNPSNPAQAMTPYEAMSHLFVQCRHCFDPTTLAAFVRMMGVYPPGSVVQLSDGRYALVVSVNASRPLKPCVIIHDRSVPREDALVVDLGADPPLSIRRSLRPLQLPKATFDYLSPRQRMCYFFEHGRILGDVEKE